LTISFVKGDLNTQYQHYPLSHLLAAYWVRRYRRCCCCRISPCCSGM